MKNGETRGEANTSHAAVSFVVVHDRLLVVFMSGVFYLPYSCCIISCW